MLPRPRCSLVSIFIRFNMTTPGRCRDCRRTIVSHKKPHILTKTISEEDAGQGSGSSLKKSDAASRRRHIDVVARWTKKYGEPATAGLMRYRQQWQRRRRPALRRGRR